MTIRWSLASAMALATVMVAAQEPPVPAPAPAPAAVAAGPAPAASPLKTPTERNSYAMGATLGAAVRKITLPLDNDMVMRGFKDALLGEQMLLTVEEARSVVTQMQNDQKAKALLEARAIADKSKQDSLVFLAVNKTRKGVITLPSGLQYKVLKTGKGNRPKGQDEVVCHYRGTLIDGREFDSSYSRQQPATFALGNVIKGWTEALQLMTVGSKWQLFVPPELAYGERGSGQMIGPNAALIFEVELLSIRSKP